MNNNNKLIQFNKRFVTVIITFFVFFIISLFLIKIFNNQDNTKKVNNATRKIYASAIEFNDSDYTMHAGDILTLIPEINPITLNENCADRQAIFEGNPNIINDPPVKWKSSNPIVASISNGIVTAHSNGTATITVTTANGEKATCTIIVTNNPDYNRIHYIANGTFIRPASTSEGKGASPANTIVLESNNHFALIDTGLANSNEDNPGHADKVISYLNKIGANKLDFIIISHAHFDHLGGLSTILDNIQVDNVYLKPYYSRDEDGSGNENTRKRYANILKKYFSTFNCNDNCLASASSYRTAIGDVDSLYGTKQTDVGALHMTSTLNKINASSSGTTLHLGNAEITLYNTSNLGYYSSCAGLDENSNSIVSYVKMGNKTALIAGDLEPISRSCYINVYNNPYNNCSSSSSKCSLMSDVISNILTSTSSSTLNVDLYELTHHGYSSCDMTTSLRNKLNPSKIVIANWKEKIDYYYGNNGYYSGSTSCKDQYFNTTYYNNTDNYRYVADNNLIFDFTNNEYNIYTIN